MRRKEIEDAAGEAGIRLIGFGGAEPFGYEAAVRDRIRRGFIPDELLEADECLRCPDVYSDPRQTLPEARCVIAVGEPYAAPDELDGGGEPDRPRGPVARHVRRPFYALLAQRREKLIGLLRAGGVSARPGRLHPREVAVRAGLGWFGKNACIITPRFGSWVVLSSIVADADVPADKPLDSRCGECRLCLDACPTGAIVEPYVIDAGRCINYLTLSVQPVPRHLRGTLGARINGCDTCQEVCPWNARAERAPADCPPALGRFGPRPDLVFLLKEAAQAFTEGFAELDWAEASPRYLRRNALVALGNSGRRELVDVVEVFLGDADPLVRQHAAWALGRLGGERARESLRLRGRREKDGEVRGEIEEALRACGG